MCGILFHLSQHEEKESNFQNDSQLDHQLVEFKDEEEISHIINLDLFNDCETNADPFEDFFSSLRLAQLSKILSQENESNVMFAQLIPKILARGPNYASLEAFKSFGKFVSSLKFFSSVLSLRSPFTKQPITDSRFVLQFNGELYNSDVEHGDEGNDTSYFMTKLHENVQNVSEQDFESFEKAIIKTTSLLDGEFAFNIYDKLHQKVYFGKDACGKRSLLYYIDSKSRQFALSSVSPYNNQETDAPWIDCRGNTLYVLNIESFTISQHDCNKFDLLFKVNRNFAENYSHVHNPEDSPLADVVEKFEQLLTNAIEERINAIHPLRKQEALQDKDVYVPCSDLTTINKDGFVNSRGTLTNSKFGILFSGGIDCTLITALAADVLLKSLSTASVDLLNVSFENRRNQTKYSATPDRKLGLKSWYGLSQKYPQVHFNFIEVNVPYEEYVKGKARVRKLMYPHQTEMDLSIAIAFFFASRGWGLRVVLPEKRPTELNAEFFESLERIDNIYSNSKVLLSGLGADELFGGYSRHDRVFNSFLFKDKLTKNNSSEAPPKTTELLVLMERFPRFNVGHQQELLKKHTAYLLEGYDLFRAELEHDISVIWQRNLSRDDRVISSWGKELRYPFLSYDVIQYACTGVPLNYKIWIDWFNVGNKKMPTLTKKFLLRRLADRLGLQFVSEEPKRAIQFGAKSAKMEPGQGRVKGTDVL